LCISKQIVEKFNGVINFVSKYNKGSTFFYSMDVFPFESLAHFKEEKENKEQVV